MLTAFPSLIFVAKKTATKTINYKAAAYGGVRRREFSFSSGAQVLKIKVNSKLHKCFHEAGHIEAAYIWGAYVKGAFLESDGNARASVQHKEDLSTKEPVACGGFAVEWILFQSGEFVDESGHVLPEKEFKTQAMDAARLDKCPFYLKKPIDEQGIYPGSPYQPNKDWEWPPESDEPFMNYAIKNIVPKLKERIEVIEVLANNLCKNGSLSQQEIEKIRDA